MFFMVAFCMFNAQLVCATNGPLVKLNNGVQYQGKSEHDGDSFRGIRYGQSPEGILRFAPPQMYAPQNDDVIDATKLGHVCPQNSCTNTGCSEDCLLLNIFTGTNATAQAVDSGNLLPVAIFVHGGSYMSGSGNLYPGGPLVNYMDGKGIVVAINYRLGALGFLGSSQMRAIDTKDGSTGNMGIQDQRLAFQWVKENIAAFGGNADKVMIFGESAGAGSMTMHITMKKSFGLYSRVILESGAFAQWNMQPMAHAQSYYDAFISFVNCTANDMACLQSLSLDEIHTAYNAVAGDVITADPYLSGPTIDGVEATVHPWVAAANGDVNNVPVLFGTNRDEGSMFCDLQEDATLDDLHDYWTTFDVNAADQDVLDEVYVNDKTYPELNGATENWWAGMRSLGDNAMSCPANYAADKLHTQQPMYQYFFQHVSNYANGHDGLVIHGSELPFVLHLKNIFFNIKDRKMSDIMSSYWINFMLSESGDPNEHHAGNKYLPHWPQYTDTNPSVLNIIDYDNIKPVQSLKKTECNFWIPFVDQSIRDSTIITRTPHTSQPPNVGKTALDEYVWAEDNNYGWTELEDHEIHGTGLLHVNKGWKGYTLNVTSQQWLTPETFADTSSSGSIWYHILVVIVPDEVKYKKNASMYITGLGQPNPDGSNLPTAKDENIRTAAALAISTGIITGCLFQIPNEHTTFVTDPIQKSRGEDAIIAFTWDHFLNNTKDTEWLLRFPMVKGSLRAMDAMTEFVSKKLPELETSLDYYIVAGASKRGWTTWDVGAVDPERVVAIIPIVLDAINFVQVMHHQYQSYGGWSWALSDYVDMNIMSRIDDPNMLTLQYMVDPYFYRNRLIMPKLVVNAVADEFQQPDDTHYWWDDMPGPKHFIMTPNAEHSEATGILEVVPAISAWVETLLENNVIPEFTWDISVETGAITATLNEHGDVKEARVWYAYSCGNNPDGKKRRDFRIANVDSPCECGIEAQGMCANLKSFWTPKKLIENKNVNGMRTYTAKVDAPDDGRWVAFFIDIVYANNEVDALIPKIDILPGFIPRDLIQRLQFTTEVSVWPNTFPYSGCGIQDGVDTGIDCAGTIR
jgi:carboxylesterase type B/PhoPQ-activated pathogenicity-related protein